MATTNKIAIIGGSAGSLPVVVDLLKQLPANFKIPIIIVLHRQRNVKSELVEILAAIPNSKIIEPDDKDKIESGCIYLAPQNYHLLLEIDGTVSLDYSELVRYSRPSIDVTLESASMVYGSGVTAIILSGANNDGTSGVNAILKNRGTAIVQEPSSAQYAAMPYACIKGNVGSMVMTPAEISVYLKKLNSDAA